ncbi:MAG: hypothetical protein JW774_02320 [Candidatus Aureabacteria bacterium]|nr:hypothetical protein [Candidatus Auribacterota bacterium]
MLYLKQFKFISHVLIASLILQPVFPSDWNSPGKRCLAQKSLIQDIVRKQKDADGLFRVMMDGPNWRDVKSTAIQRGYNPYNPDDVWIVLSDLATDRFVQYQEKLNRAYENAVQAITHRQSEKNMDRTLSIFEESADFLPYYNAALQRMLNFASAAAELYGPASFKTQAADIRKLLDGIREIQDQYARQLAELQKLRQEQDKDTDLQNILQNLKAIPSWTWIETACRKARVSLEDIPALLTFLDTTAEGSILSLESTRTKIRTAEEELEKAIIDQDNLFIELSKKLAEAPISAEEVALIEASSDRVMHAYDSLNTLISTHNNTLIGLRSLHESLVIIRDTIRDPVVSKQYRVRAEAVRNVLDATPEIIRNSLTDKYLGMMTKNNKDLYWMLKPEQTDITTQVEQAEEALKALRKAEQAAAAAAGENGTRENLAQACNTAYTLVMKAHDITGKFRKASMLALKGLYQRGEIAYREMTEFMQTLERDSSSLSAEAHETWNQASSQVIKASMRNQNLEDQTESLGGDAGVIQTGLTVLAEPTSLPADRAVLISTLQQRLEAVAKCVADIFSSEQTAIRKNQEAAVLFSRLITCLESLTAVPDYQPTVIQEPGQMLSREVSAKNELNSLSEKSLIQKNSHAVVPLLESVRTMLVHYTGRADAAADDLRWQIRTLMENREKARAAARIVFWDLDRQMAAIDQITSQIQALETNVRSVTEYRNILSVWAERILETAELLETLTDASMEEAVRRMNPEDILELITETNEGVTSQRILRQLETEAQENLARDEAYLRSRNIGRVVQGGVTAWNFIQDTFTLRNISMAMLIAGIGLLVRGDVSVMKTPIPLLTPSPITETLPPVHTEPVVPLETSAPVETAPSPETTPEKKPLPLHPAAEAVQTAKNYERMIRAMERQKEKTQEEAKMLLEKSDAILDGRIDSLQKEFDGLSDKDKEGRRGQRLLRKIEKCQNAKIKSRETLQPVLPEAEPTEPGPMVNPYDAMIDSAA